MTDIRVIFVLHNSLDDESDMSPTMVQAYDSCKQLVQNILWVKEADLSAMKFSKLDYLVFECFEDRDFSQFTESKCAVVGPLAISVCLMEGKPIPSFQWPIQNVALYGCEVTCSQLSKSSKEDIKKKVQLMGGFYTGNFTDSTTHLICDGTKSEKYMLAVEKNAKLMLPSWINTVFEQSQTSNVNGNDPKILEKFKCPPFHNLTICCTGITNSKERMKLSEIISANGGTLVPKLVLSKTDVLICHGSAGTTSDKYKAARNTPHISCVTIDWVFDSVEKGHSLPHELYRVKTVTSTPTKDGENIDPNFSTISAIGGSLCGKRTGIINDTMNNTGVGSVNLPSSVLKRTSNKRKADNDLVEKIDIKKVKNAGNFLDGCSVFVAGFSPTQRDKLNKIINISGATRYDDFSERVTHVIVGDQICPEVTAIKEKPIQCCLVTVKWLLDSVDQQKPADEEKYIISENSKDMDKSSTCSPLSKKVINFLRQDHTIPHEERENLKGIEELPENDDPLTQKYLKSCIAPEKEDEDTLAKLLEDQNDPNTLKSRNNDFTIKSRPLLKRGNSQDINQTLEFKPDSTSTQVTEVTGDLSEEEILPIFKNLKFVLEGFDEENTELYTELITAAGGDIPDKRFKGICDFAVLPTVYKQINFPPAQEIVNDLWLQECLENISLVSNDIPYYNRPIDLPSTCPLKGCVITISGYAGGERTFLKAVIEGLGGVCQELFSKKANEARNVLPATHLVSSEASGKKYEAALKWNLPATTKDWLLACATTGKKESVNNFLVKARGDSTLNNSDHNGKISADEKRTNFDKPSAPTPKPSKTGESETPNTPVNQIYNLNKKNTPDACSQVTPINKILQDAINNKVLPTPPSPKTYFPWDPKTPDTPIGAFITPNPSPRLRKEMQKYVNSFPEFIPPKRRLSTPLSELERRLMDKVLGRGEYSQCSQEDNGPSTQELAQQLMTEELKEKNQPKGDASGEEKQPHVENAVVHQKLQELQQKVMASGSSSATRRSSRMFEASSTLPGIEKTNVDVQSQVYTVGWDYGEEKSQKQKIFMLSGVEASQREQMANQLKKLGAVVCEGSNYDSSCTHLICPKPGRNEKTLCCMAAGKWILHVSYIEKSITAGHFLNEEEFEFGNPKAKTNIFYEEKDASVHYWRKEISRRGYGAFNDMRAIVIAEKREPITNVIESGGGVVINIKPPFDDSIHATHCLLEIKMVKDFSKYVVLAQQGIKCINTVYIHNFLSRNTKDDVDYIIPYFSKYYK